MLGPKFTEPFLKAKLTLVCRRLLSLVGLTASSEPFCLLFGLRGCLFGLLAGL